MTTEASELREIIKELKRILEDAKEVLRGEKVE